jgi:hypothetical protein
MWLSTLSKDSVRIGWFYHILIPSIGKIPDKVDMVSSKFNGWFTTHNDSNDIKGMGKGCGAGARVFV